MWPAWAPFPSPKQQQQWRQPNTATSNSSKVFAEFSLFAPPFPMDLAALAFQPPEPNQLNPAAVNDDNNKGPEIQQWDRRAVQPLDADESRQQPQQNLQPQPYQHPYQHRQELWQPRPWPEQRQAHLVRERYELPEAPSEPKPKPKPEPEQPEKFRRQAQLARERYELPAAANMCCDSLLLPLSALSPVDVGDQISSDMISFGDIIGEGRFGEVYRGNYTGQAVAIKHFKVSTSTAEPEAQEKAMKMFENEVRILKSLRHPNIVNYLGLVRFPFDNGAVTYYSDNAGFGSSSDSDDWLRGQLRPSKYSMLSYCIVTELCASGTLFDFLRKRRPLSWAAYLRIAKDIVSGLLFLHRKNIIHRDLKPGNVLMSESGTAKLADFGLAHFKQTDSYRPYGRCGTRCFVAPEVLLDKPYGVEADVFSLGVILCQMITSFYTCDMMMSSFSTSFSTISSDSSVDPTFGKRVCAVRRPPIPNHTLPDLRKLIQACWASNPGRRPAVSNVLEWLDSISRNLNLPEKSAFDEVLEDLSSSSRQYIEQLQARIEELSAELNSTKESFQQISAQLEESEKLRKIQLVCAQSKYQHLQELHECLQRQYRTSRTRPLSSLALSADGLMSGRDNLSGSATTAFLRRSCCLTSTS